MLALEWALLLLFTRTNWSVSRGRDREGYGVKAGMGYRDEAFGPFFFVELG